MHLQGGFHFIRWLYIKFSFTREKDQSLRLSDFFHWIEGLIFFAFFSKSFCTRYCKSSSAPSSTPAHTLIYTGGGGIIEEHDHAQVSVDSVMRALVNFYSLVAWPICLHLGELLRIVLLALGKHNFQLQVKGNTGSRKVLIYKNPPLGKWIFITT